MSSTAIRTRKHIHVNTYNNSTQTLTTIYRNIVFIRFGRFENELFKSYFIFGMRHI